MIKYEDWSKKYDQTREYNPMVIAKMLEYITQKKNERILDFGCGTGNYLEAISKITPSKLYAVDASEEMLLISQKKGIKADFNIGNHKAIPFENDYFDFIYMLDVLQHIPKDELNYLFQELNRVIKPHGTLFILTVSHQQISNRTWNKYFPSAENLQISRFPSISSIYEYASMYHLHPKEKLELEQTRYEIIPELFVKHVCNKAYSIFHLIDDIEYQKGKELLLKDYMNKKSWKYNHGETIIVLKK